MVRNGVSIRGLVSSAVRWAQRCRQIGSVTPHQMDGHRKPVLDRAFILEGSARRFT